MVPTALPNCVEADSVELASFAVLKSARINRRGPEADNSMLSG